ncbi:MAG: DUF2752 domain-containing protein [Myxococcota bacterium]
MDTSRTKFPRGWSTGLAAIVAVVGVGLLARGYDGPGLPCVFHYITGYPCPGCGSTRAVRALAYGRLAEAFWLNPLFVVALLGTAAWLGWTWWSGRPARFRWPLWTAVVAVLLNWSYLLSSGAR